MTITPTVTTTPPITPTPTTSVTNTPSITPTITSTISPSATAGTTPTPTTTPTITPSVTITPTISPTPTQGTLGPLPKTIIVEDNKFFKGDNSFVGSFNLTNEAAQGVETVVHDSYGTYVWNGEYEDLAEAEKAFWDPTPPSNHTFNRKKVYINENAKYSFQKKLVWTSYHHNGMGWNANGWVLVGEGYGYAADYDGAVFYAEDIQDHSQWSMVGDSVKTYVNDTWYMQWSASASRWQLFSRANPSELKGYTEKGSREDTLKTSLFFLQQGANLQKFIFNLSETGLPPKAVIPKIKELIVPMGGPNSGGRTENVKFKVVGESNVKLFIWRAENGFYGHED